MDPQRWTVVRPGTVIDFAPCANFGVIPSSVFAKVECFPAIFKVSGTLQLEVQDFDGCVEADLGRMRSKRCPSMCTKRIVMCLARGFWPMIAVPKTGKCSCGSNFLFTDCCKVVCTALCKNAKCINPTHIKITQLRGSEDTLAGRALRRVPNLDVLVNRLTPPNMCKLSKMYTKSRTQVLRKAIPYLTALLCMDVRPSVAYDLVVFAHSQNAYDEYESTLEQDDLIDGIRPMERRFVSTNAARFTKSMIYQHARVVADQLNDGATINIAAYVRGMSYGAVTINENTFRNAVKKVREDEQCYTRDKPKHDANAKAKSLVMRYQTRDAREIWDMVADSAKAAGLVKKNVMRVIRRAIRHRNSIASKQQA